MQCSCHQCNIFIVKTFYLTLSFEQNVQIILYSSLTCIHSTTESKINTTSYVLLMNTFSDLNFNFYLNGFHDFDSSVALTSTQLFIYLQTRVGRERETMICICPCFVNSLKRFDNCLYSNFFMQGVFVEQITFKATFLATFAKGPSYGEFFK